MPAFGTEIKNKILAAQNTTLGIYESMMSCFGVSETESPPSPLQTEEMIREAIAEVQVGSNTGLLDQEETEGICEENSTTNTTAVSTAQPNLLFQYLNKIGLNKISQYFGDRDNEGYQLVQNDLIPHVESANNPAPTSTSTQLPTQPTYEPPKPVPTPLPRDDNPSATAAPSDTLNESTLSLYQSAIENPEPKSAPTSLPAKPMLNPKEDRSRLIAGLKLPPTGEVRTNLSQLGLKL